MIHSVPLRLFLQMNLMLRSCHAVHGLSSEQNLSRPVLSVESMKDDMSNELGANGKVDYLKNINGLWLIQESRREWKRQGNNFSFSNIEKLAEFAEPFISYIDPDSPDFASPGDIPEKIRSFCKKTEQIIPENVGAIARCINESLAMKYRFTLEQIQNRTGEKTYCSAYGWRRNPIQNIVSNDRRQSRYSGDCRACRGNSIWQCDHPTCRIESDPKY